MIVVKFMTALSVESFREMIKKYDFEALNTC